MLLIFCLFDWSLFFVCVTDVVFVVCLSFVCVVVFSCFLFVCFLVVCVLLLCVVSCFFIIVLCVFSHRLTATCELHV